MPRDNFTPLTKKILGESVGFNCVRPGCAKPTTALNSNEENISRLGYTAHDSAAARGGPRYDKNLTAEQRRSQENGAHLCPTCARLVDIDPERFPIGTIQSWQQKAMDIRQKRMHMPHPPSGLDFKAACEGAQKFLRACQNISIDTWTKSASWMSLCAMEEFVRASFPMSATNPLCAQFPHMVNLQLEMIESIKSIIWEIKYSGNWTYSQDFRCFYLNNIEKILPTPQQREKNESIEHSFFLVETRMFDFFENANRLNSIARSPYSVIDLYGW